MAAPRERAASASADLDLRKATMAAASDRLLGALQKEKVGTPDLVKVDQPAPSGSVTRAARPAPPPLAVEPEPEPQPEPAPAPSSAAADTFGNRALRRGALATAGPNGTMKGASGNGDGNGHSGNGHSGNGHSGNGHNGNGHGSNGHVDGGRGDGATMGTAVLTPVAPDSGGAVPVSSEGSHGGDGHRAVTSTIRELASLRDDGILTDAEFDAKKAELLARI